MKRCLFILLVPMFLFGETQFRGLDFFLKPTSFKLDSTTIQRTLKLTTKVDSIFKGAIVSFKPNVLISGLAYDLVNGGAPTSFQANGLGVCILKQAQEEGKTKTLWSGDLDFIYRNAPEAKNQTEIGGALSVSGLGGTTIFSPTVGIAGMYKQVDGKAVKTILFLLGVSIIAGQ